MRLRFGYLGVVAVWGEGRFQELRGNAMAQRRLNGEGSAEALELLIACLSLSQSRQECWQDVVQYRRAGYNIWAWEMPLRTIDFCRKT